MSAPLTETREKKILMIKEIHSLTFDLVMFPKSSLDKMDFRLLTKLLKNLKDLKEHAEPYTFENNKINSSK